MNNVPKGQPSLFLCHWIVCWHDENFTFLEKLKDCKKHKMDEQNVQLLTLDSV